jgi:predicted P-loop ATPase
MAMLCGASEVKVIPWDKDKDEGWDGADAADGWTDKRTGEVFSPWSQKDVLAWIKSRVFVWTPDPAEMAEVDAEAFTRPFVDREPAEAAPAHDEPPPANPEDYGQGFEPDYEPAPPPNGRSREARQTQQEALDPERKPSNVVNLKGEPVDDTDWRTGLVYSSGDDPKLKPKALQNIMLFVQHHKQLAGVFAYDDFAKQVVLLRRPPWWPANEDWTPRALQDEDLVRCTGFLETLHLTPKVTDTTNAIIAAAVAQKFNPVQDHLLGLKWDGVPRLTGGMVEGESIGCWLAEYLGADDTDVNRAFSLRWMISAAARALRPGCKCDTMLILEGEQGAMKSTALRVLGTFGGHCYYTDEVGELNSKDAAMQLQGVVIVEIGELNALGRAEANAIKAWLARQVDRFRPPFGKAVRDFPRQCVLAGTMNPVGNGYLKDETGGRRFFPVLVTDVDLEALRRDADQLWAEAVHRFHAGEQWWLTPEEAVMAGKVVAERYEEDAWADAIDNFLECRAQVRLQEIMEECLSIPKERQNQMVEKRIAKHLRHRRWLRQKVYVKLMGKPKWVYVSPDT